MSGDDSNSIESTKPKSSRSNIDLFAAGERKVPKAPSNSTPNPADKDVVVSAEKVKPVAVDVGVASSSITDVATPASVVSPASSRNSMIELQAELLRLEAEREQLEIDQLRLDEEKVRFLKNGRGTVRIQSTSV